MKPKQRDIFLVPFPFSDLSDKKIRPVLVLSNDRFNETNRDVVVCGITSNVTKQEYTLLITSKDLEEGTLHAASAVKVESLLKLSQGLLIKKIGKLKKEKLREGIQLLDVLFKPT